MNNSKWQKFFTLLQDAPVYLQLKLVGDSDFHIDYEQANLVISEIEDSSFVYVRRKLNYKELLAVRICKKTIPKDVSRDAVMRFIEQVKKLGQLHFSENEDFFTLYGYEYHEMTCSIEAKIRLLKGGWKIAEEDDDSKYVKMLKVNLTIQGDPKSGYHLLMQPVGMFVADYHYNTRAEALEDAQELFGVNADNWITVA